MKTIAHYKRRSTVFDISRGLVVGVIAIGLLTPIATLRNFHGADADQVYSLTLFGDIWDKVSPFRWALPPANGLFPDLVIAAFGYAVGLDGLAYFLFYATAYAILKR